MLDLNVVGTISVTKAALPHILAQPGGGLVAVTSSLSGKLGTPVGAIYAACKFALHGYFERWASPLCRAIAGPALVKYRARTRARSELVDA